MAKYTKEQKFVKLYGFLKANKVILILLIPPLTPFGLLALLFRGLFAPHKSAGLFVTSLLAAIAIAGVPVSVIGLSSVAKESEERVNAEYEEKLDYVDGKEGYLVSRDRLLPDLEPFAANFAPVFEHYQALFDLLAGGADSNLIYDRFAEFQKSGLNVDYPVIESDSKYLVDLEEGTFGYRSPIDENSHQIEDEQVYGRHFATMEMLDPSSSFFAWYDPIQARLEAKEEYALKAAKQEEMASILKKELARDEGLYDFSIPVDVERERIERWRSANDNSFFLSILPVDLGIGCGAAAYCLLFANVVISSSLQAKYKKNRKAIFALRDDLSFFVGQEKCDELEKTLTRCSKKKDFDGFYSAVQESEAAVASCAEPYSFKHVASLNEQTKEAIAALANGFGKEKAKEFKGAIKEARQARDLPKVNALLAEANETIESKLPEPGVEGGPLTKAGSSSYNATILSNFFYRKWIGFVGTFLFSLLTLGYAKLWADCAAQGYLADHTVIDGRKLDFDGKPMQLFGNNLKVKVLNILTFTIYGRLKKFSLKSWVCKHTKIEGYSSQEKGKFNGSSTVVLCQKWAFLLLNLLTLGLFSPFFVVKKQKYLAKHTYYQGVRLKFTASAGSYYKTHFTCWLLNLVTLGIYSPWASLKKAKWVAENTHFDLAS